MKVFVRNGNLEGAIRALNVQLQKDNLKRAQTLRAIPKPSDRIREKARLAQVRKLKNKNRRNRKTR